MSLFAAELEDPQNWNIRLRVNVGMIVFSLFGRIEKEKMLVTDTFSFLTVFFLKALCFRVFITQDCVCGKELTLYSTDIHFDASRLNSF